MEFTCQQASISPVRTADHVNMKHWNVPHFMFVFEEGVLQSCDLLACRFYEGFLFFLGGGGWWGSWAVEICHSFREYSTNFFRLSQFYFSSGL